MPEDPWWKDSPDGYEVLDHMTDESGEAELAASYTPSNGIRIGIINTDDDGERDWFWREFDFTADQAEKLGQALLRWAAARRR